MRIPAALALVAAVLPTALPGASIAAPSAPPRPPRAPVWGWPLGPHPTVVRPFQPGAHRWDRAHRGVDLVEPVDPAGRAADPTRVTAAGSGTVLVAGQVFGHGVVVIGHGSLRTSYEPVTAVVPVGAAVVRGQWIGTLQPGHCAAVRCLHWGLLAGQGRTIRYYDPMILLGLGRVRLEPADTR